MADKVLPGPVENKDFCRCQKVNIHTMKISDACRDKDCIEDLTVYPFQSSQKAIENAFSIRPVAAELIYADVNVEEINFNRGYYTVDVSYFYKITGEIFPGGIKVRGLAVFDKRVILYGGEGGAKSFSSLNCGCTSKHHSKPIAVVEAVDPIALNMRIAENKYDCCNNDHRSIPEHIKHALGEDVVIGETCKKLLVTLGQFSMIRLERDTQLSLDDFEYFVPNKDCVCSSEDDPCTLFSRVDFPTDEFYPPDYNLCEH